MNNNNKRAIVASLLFLCFVFSLRSQVMSGSDTVRLGGDLSKQTLINLNDSNLIFNRNSGRIGIGTANPNAIIQIANLDSIDPLILENINFLSEINRIDNPNSSYYNLRVSENGTVRKAKAVVSKTDQLFVYNLRNYSVAMDLNSLADIVLPWTKDGVDYDYITLPESGTYVFSFRLYGNTRWSQPNTATAGINNTSGSFILSAYKNGTLHNETEIVIFLMGRDAALNYTVGYVVATYSVNISVTGVAGDKIQFKMRRTGGSVPWRLNSPPATNPNVAYKTSMFFWRR